MLGEKYPASSILNKILPVQHIFERKNFEFKQKLFLIKLFYSNKDANQNEN